MCRKQRCRKLASVLKGILGFPTRQDLAFTLGSEMPEASNDFFQSHLFTKEGSLGRHQKTFPIQGKNLKPQAPFRPFEDC
jgi:hypothetical protein